MGEYLKDGDGDVEIGKVGTDAEVGKVLVPLAPCSKVGAVA